MSAEMVYDSDLRRYVWHGGEYIDVGPIPMNGEEFQALDVLNVWDHAKGEPSIPRSLWAFEKRCKEADLAFEGEFMADDGPIDYELAEYLRNGDFDDALERAEKLDEEGDIDRETLENVQNLAAEAQRI